MDGLAGVSAWLMEGEGGRSCTLLRLVVDGCLEIDFDEVVIS